MVVSSHPHTIQKDSGERHPDWIGETIPTIPIREFFETRKDILLRISPPIGTVYRTVWLVAGSPRKKPTINSALMIEGPYHTLDEAEDSLYLLPIELGCPILIAWLIHAEYRIDAEGALHYKSALDLHPEVGQYDFGTARDLYIRRYGTWLPRGVAIDYEPARTERLASRLEAYEPALRPYKRLTPEETQ